MNLFKFGILLCSFFALTAYAQKAGNKLTGTVIGTTYSVDYDNGNAASTTVNTKDCAFDGDLNTYFASYDRSFAWVGLDLGSPHVITKVGWSPRNYSDLGPKRVQLAVFEGANKADFSDAVPLFVNDERTPIGTYGYASVHVSKGFRYVRYVGPNDQRCNVAEVEFYGYAGEGHDGEWYRPGKIPVVSIHIENNAEPWDKVNELNCEVTLIPADENDTIKTKTATIRLRGNASKDFPKKPYRIKFEKKHHVFGSPASAKKWTLINNYGDKSLMRNILAFDMSRRLEMEYTPFCVPVDVFVNGEYKGCYQLCDQVEVHKNRVEVEEMDPSYVSGDELSGGYFVEVDAYASSEPRYFWSSKGNPVNVRYPSDTEIVQQQINYIKNQFNTLESKLFASNFTTDAGYRSYLDLESFLRHFLVGEFSGNTDTYWSTNMYKHRSDNHFYVGPVWDFDLAYENDNRTYPINGLNDWVYKTRGSYAGDMRNFVNRIVNSDTKARNRLQEIWADARWHHGVKEERLLAYVDEIAELLDESQHLNFIRWPILSSYVHQNWQASGSYTAEVEIIKNYIKERIQWIDKKLNFDSTGIEDVDYAEEQIQKDSDIFTVDGKNVGKDINALPKGIYIRNGKKFLVR